MANKEDVKSMGRRIRERREQLRRERGGFTQADVATKLGQLTGTKGERVTYAHYEIGNNAIAATDLPALSKVLECSIGYFFGDVPMSSVEEDDAVKNYKRMPEIMKPAARAVLKALYDVGTSK